MVLRARCILPMGEPLVENGALQVQSGRVQWVGKWPQCQREPGEKVFDLGEVVLLPGLINAHCHLDYTAMAGKIPPPRHFPDWVQNILAFKSQWSADDYSQSWREGARMLLECGVTTVANIESAPDSLRGNWESTPLRIFSFLEMTSVRSGRHAEEVLQEACERIDSLPRNETKQAALSPHALYSTTPELCRKSAALARNRKWLISTHIAESEAEFEMFANARGTFYDWLKGLRDMSDCRRGSPIQLAEEYGLLGPDFLAVHVNYLAPGDLERLERTRTPVVHCPRSHRYFKHRPFPLDQFQKAGINVCLGTDSLATTPEQDGRTIALDLWEEMRLFAGNHPWVHPKAVFKMVTTQAAKALGKEHEIGEFRSGAYADATTLFYNGKLTDPGLYESLLFENRVREVFLSGELVRTADAR